VRQQLLNHYLPLVRNVAGRMALGFPKSVEVSDLVSTGVIGLIEALKNFDPERGVKFETFAVRGSAAPFWTNCVRSTGCRVRPGPRRAKSTVRPSASKTASAVCRPGENSPMI